MTPACISKVIFGKSLSPQGNQLRETGLEILMPPWPSGRGEGLEVESIISGQWFNQSWLCNDASIKAQKDRVWRDFRSVNIQRFGECYSQREHEGSAPFPISCPMQLFHLVVSRLHAFIINWWCVLWATLANWWNWGQGYGNLWSVVSGSEA